MVLAVFLINLPLTYGLSQSSASDPNVQWTATGFYEWLVSGFVTYGVYRCVFDASRTGHSISLGEVFARGKPCWGRNFRLNWVFSLCVFCLVLVVLVPSALIYAVIGGLSGGNPSAVAICLSAATSIVSILWALRVILRLSLSAAWLADDSRGPRVRAMQALSESWQMTKAAGIKPITWAFLAFLLLYGFLTLLSYGLYMAVGEGPEGLVSQETAAWLDILLLVPAAFLSVLVTCTFAMLYAQYCGTDLDVGSASFSRPSKPASGQPPSVANY